MTDHDIVTRDLEARLRDSALYDLILVETEYKTHRQHGECDILAIRGPYAVLVEIKGLDRMKSRKKAYSQLKRDIRWIYDRFPEVDRIFSFYAYKNKKEVNIEWIRDI